MHSYDTAGVMEYLYHNWLPLAVIKVIGKDFGEEMGLKVCLFLAYIHDAGKLCSQFQSGVAEQVRDIRGKIVSGSYFTCFIQKPDEKDTSSLCGEGILRKYGVPVGIAVIVGSHHGSTPEYYSDIAEENIETYGKDVIFWTAER